jgi:selenocysteine lyase/cysteine desulfurase
MDVAARGLISQQVCAALDAHLDGLASGNVNKDDFFALVELTRARFASMVKAQTDEIAFTKNVSEGLNMVATGLPWEAGDNVIVCSELEHPNNVYCWLNFRQHGVEVRTVAPRQGHLPVDDMIQCMDARTRAVTASTVTFAPGFRTDIDRLGQAFRDRGIFFLLDAAQSCGVLKTERMRGRPTLMDSRSRPRRA